jgi:hypothetical protein
LASMYEYKVVVAVGGLGAGFLKSPGGSEARRGNGAAASQIMPSFTSKCNAALPALIPHEVPLLVVHHDRKLHLASS